MRMIRFNAADRASRASRGTRTPWVQHTLARDAPSLHPNLLFLPNSSRSPLQYPLNVQPKVSNVYFTLCGNSVQNSPRRTPGATNPRLPVLRDSFFNHHPWTSVQVGLRQYPEVAAQNTGGTTPRLPVPRGPFLNHLLPCLKRRRGWHPQHLLGHPWKAAPFRRS